MATGEWWLYAIVVGAAAAHAAWNVAVKGSTDQLLALTGIRLVGLPIAVGLLLFFPFPEPAAWVYLGLNALFIYGYYATLLYAYARADLSVVYPVARGSAPVVVLLVSLLGGVDSISLPQAIATIVICCGLWLLGNVSTRSSAGRPILAALTCGIMIAGYTLSAALGARASASSWGYLAASEILAACGLVPFAFYRRRGQVVTYLQKFKLQVVVSGGLSVAAFGSVLWVMTQLPVAPVAAVRESSVAFAVLFGWWFLSEKPNPNRIIALVLTLTGVVMLALGG